MDLDGLDNSVFDIDNKIGLDTIVEKKKTRKYHKKAEEELNIAKDSDDPEYQLAKDNMSGRANSSGDKELEMPADENI